MSTKDSNQNEIARQEFAPHEKRAILNYSLSPAFFVRLRESINQNTNKQASRGIR